MGDTPPEACKTYRAWAKAQLQATFPEYAIEVLAIPSLITYATNDLENEETIATFCQQLWDTCPWDWLDIG
jgi:glutathione peroxidase-family protein